MMSDWQKRVDMGIDQRFYEQYVRPLLIRQRGNYCENCGTPPEHKLDIHHEDYNNMNINTIKLWCRSCHLKHHNMEEDFK